MFQVVGAVIEGLNGLVMHCTRGPARMRSRWSSAFEELYKDVKVIEYVPDLTVRGTIVANVKVTGRIPIMDAGGCLNTSVSVTGRLG